MAVLRASGAHVAKATLRAGSRSPTIFASTCHKIRHIGPETDMIQSGISRTLANEVSFAGVFGI